MLLDVAILGNRDEPGVPALDEWYRETMVSNVTRRTLVASLGALSAAGMSRQRSQPVAARACEAELPEGANERITFASIAEGLPLTAPGQHLHLYRFTLPAGETLPAHSHPGATML